jgi:HEAT repeat protein
VNSLIGLLSLADSLRFRVIRALGRLRVARAATKLESLYGACALHEQLEIIGALVLIDAPGVRAFLHARLAEPELEVRRAAARGLAALAAPGDLAHLRVMAVDGDWNVRNEAARGLARLPLDDTRQVLLDLARDIESIVSATAREALGGTVSRSVAGHA